MSKQLGLLVLFVTLSFNNWPLMTAAELREIQSLEDELERMFDAIKEHNDDDDDHNVESPELVDRNEPDMSVLESSMDSEDVTGYGGPYESRDDIFVDKRWRPVYVEDRDRERRVMTSMSENQKKIIVDLHNKYRRQEGSSNMESLRYNEKLAALGQQWCQRCRFEHGQPPFNPADFGTEHLGQNIFAHTDPKFEVDWAVKAWYDEKDDFDYNSLNCRPGKICGHYTAVTWATTTDVGCGLCFCPSISGLQKAQFIVCNYIPPGNWAGQKPFLKGPPCTQCDRGKFYCNNGLCEKSCTSAGPNCECKASCKRCGKQTNNCGCECKPGTTGPDCSATCQDLDPQCNRNPGYPEFLCTISDPNWAFVKDKCPKMCKKCIAPSGNTPSCRRQDSRKVNAIKRLMLGYLEKDLEGEDK